MNDLIGSKDVTSADIRAAIRLAYCQPEWAIFFEVGNGTGGNARRHADALALNMYPSRGLALHGFEIKISKNDWKRELADPQKAEEIAQYCDCWSLVTAPGIVGAGELPKGWGLIELRAGGKLRTCVAPKQRLRGEVRPLDRSFVAAILRSQAKIEEAQIKKIVDDRVEAIRVECRKDMDREIDQRTKTVTEWMAKHKIFAEAMKANDFRWTNEDRFARAVGAALKLGLGDEHGSLKNLVDRLRDITKNAEEALASVDAQA